MNLKCLCGPKREGWTKWFTVSTLDRVMALEPNPTSFFHPFDMTASSITFYYPLLSGMYNVEGLVSSYQSPPHFLFSSLSTVRLWNCLIFYHTVSVMNKADSWLPKLCVSGQGQWWKRLTKHLSRSSNAKNAKCDQLTDQLTNSLMEWPIDIV